MSAIQALAEDMARNEVCHVFGIPGSGASLILIDALEKCGVRFHLTHFEGTGALMAGAMGRLSGRSGVALSIKGPGLANMVPGLATCRLEAWPVVSISEAYLPRTPPSKAHKRLDHEGLLCAVSKGLRFLSEQGPKFSDLAAWAQDEVPGPVHLEIAETALKAERSIGDPQPRGGEETTWEEILDLIEAAERPAVIAGTLALRRGLFPHLNRLSIPVFSVAAAKGVVDETLAHSAGVFTGVGLELTPEFLVLPQADLVVGIGLRHNEVLGVSSFRCKAINIDPLGPMHCSGFGFDHFCGGSMEGTAEVLKGLAQKQWGIEMLRKCLDRMRAKMRVGPFSPARVFEFVEQRFRHRARLVLDTGHFCTIAEHTWRVPKPEWYLAAGQSRYMGVGLPLALGAAVYDRSAPTVVFLGDGGVGMYLADVKLAVRERLPLIVVLMSDGYLGSIRSRSIKNGLTEAPLTIHQPSWVEAVAGLGVHAARTENEGALDETLGCWSPPDGPLFIEIPFDPEAYQDMVKGIR